MELYREARPTQTPTGDQTLADQPDGPIKSVAPSELAAMLDSAAVVRKGTYTFVIGAPELIAALAAFGTPTKRTKRTLL